MGELVQKTEDDLLAITNFGQKSLDEVIAKLDERAVAPHQGLIRCLPPRRRAAGSAATPPTSGS